MSDDYTAFDEEKKESNIATDSDEINILNDNKSDNIDITEYEDRNKKSNDRPIHKSMMIADIANIYPEIVPVLMDNGLHCVGCGASQFETLEEGFYGHGMDTSDVERIIDDLNIFLKNNSDKR